MKTSYLAVKECKSIKLIILTVNLICNLISNSNACDKSQKLIGLAIIK